MWSISGFVSTTLACLRIHARSSVGGVAVVGRGDEVGHEPLAEAAELVLGERLGGEDRAARCRGAAAERPTRRSAPGSRATCPTRCRWRPRRGARRGARRSPPPGAIQRRVDAPRPEARVHDSGSRGRARRRRVLARPGREHRVARRPGRRARAGESVRACRRRPVDDDRPTVSWRRSVALEHPVVGEVGEQELGVRGR